MRIKSLVVLAAFSFASPALANNNPAIVESYQSFKDAMQIENYEAAATHAYTAWQHAEKQLGAKAETNILAQNYANLNYNVDLDHDRVVKAYFRSIELTKSRKDRNALINVLLSYAYTIEDEDVQNEIGAKLRSKYKKDNPFAFTGNGPNNFENKFNFLNNHFAPINTDLGQNAVPQTTNSR